MLKRLKSLLRRKEPVVEYRRPEEREETLLPAGPLSGQMPPAAPVQEPGAEAKTGDEERP